MRVNDRGGPASRKAPHGRWRGRSVPVAWSWAWTPPRQGRSPPPPRPIRRPYVLNTSRAAAVDYDALLEALKNGSVTAALLDVYPDEPVPRDSPLLALGMDWLHLTPHAAGVSHDIPGNTARLLAQGLCTLLSRDKPQHIANEEVLSACFQRLDKLVGHSRF